MQTSQPTPIQGVAQKRHLVPEAKHVIAIASGKGGVGKSSVAANLAVSLARAGHKVGLVDADIYGPSLAQMMGTESAGLTMSDERVIPI